MLGVYAGYDYRRSPRHNNFSQIMVGAEYWYDQWFIGGNIYKPLGSSKKATRVSTIEEPYQQDQQIWRMLYQKINYEESLAGVDLELGHSFTDNLTGYAGGYYFHGRAGTTAALKLALATTTESPMGGC